MLDTSRVYKSNNCGDLKVTKYINSCNVEVMFLGYKNTVVTTAQNIRNGEVKNPMFPSVYSVGFIGSGKYSKLLDKKAYTTWHSMLSRCYSAKLHTARPTYLNCSVVEEWLNFQNFAKWFYEESSYIEGFHLDKDILFQGNKVYSPDNCMFISPEINTLLLDSKSRRGKYKLGVTLYSGKYKSQCNDEYGIKKHIGMFDTEQAAHEAYIEYKYTLIKKLANKQTEPLKSSLLRWRLNSE